MSAYSMRKQLTENLGIIIAVAAAVIALWSAKIQRDAMHLDERPYLKISFDSIAVHQRAPDSVHEPGPDGYEVKLSIEESGKTPAFRIVATGLCDPAQKGEDNGWVHMEVPFLFDEKSVVTCFVSTRLPDGNLPPNVPLSLTVRYSDIFGSDHATTLCETIITMGDETMPRVRATGTIPESSNCKSVMN